MPQEKEKAKGILDADLSLGGVSLTDKAMFAKNLSLMLKSGLTIAEGLDTLESQATGKLRKVISNILRSIQSGTSLSDSMAKYPKIFSRFFINTVLVGESSGTLESNLENIAVQLQKDKELVTKVKGAMIYPVIILCAATVLGIGLAFFVLPKITPLFEGLRVQLPASTRFLIWFSKIIQKQGTPLLLGILAGGGLLIWLCRQKFSQPVTHYLLLHTPIVKKISINSNLATFCRTAGTLLKSGINIDEAFNITRDTINNYYYRKSLTDISMRIGHGSTIAESLRKYEKMYPTLIVNMVKVGENSGNLETTFFHMADFYELEVDHATKNLATVIEPVMLVFIGIVVGGLALSIISPIYQITGNVSR